MPIKDIFISTRQRIDGDTLSVTKKTGPLGMLLGLDTKLEQTLPAADNKRYVLTYEEQIIDCDGIRTFSRAFGEYKLQEIPPASRSN